MLDMFIFAEERDFLEGLVIVLVDGLGCFMERNGIMRDLYLPQLS